MGLDKILIVEDEEPIADFLKVSLTREGFQVVWARDGEEAVHLFARENPQAVLLDLLLPRLSGLEVLKAIRRTATTPILVVSVKDDESDKVVALELGADDYMTKPYSTRELVARIRANLRKAQQAQPRVRVGELEIDFQRAEVSRQGVRVFLTSREFELLRILHDQRDWVLSRDSLLEKVWGFDFDGDARVVDSTIKRLRKKVGQDLIETVRGTGYRLLR